jgi:hypothetical protein
MTVVPKMCSPVFTLLMLVEASIQQSLLQRLPTGHESLG